MAKVFLSALLGLLFPLCLMSQSPESYLSKVADIPLPGRSTRFDYQSLNPQTGMLYLSHMGDGRVVVFDTKARKVLADLTGFPSTTGVLVVPGLHKVYVSVPGNHEVAVVNMETFKIITRIRGGKFPDGLAYAPEPLKIFVSDEEGNKELVINVRSNKLVETLDMGGEVGNTQYDARSGHIFVNVQTRNELVEIDPKTDKILARHKLNGGEWPHGLLIDAPERLAFVACEGDAKLLVIDLKNFEVKQAFSTGEGLDVLAFDTVLRRLYVGCEGGVVSIFQLKDRRLKKLEDNPVGNNCHSVSVDSQTHFLYVPLKNVSGTPVLRIMRPERLL